MRSHKHEISSLTSPAPELCAACLGFQTPRAAAELDFVLMERSSPPEATDYEVARMVSGKDGVIGCARREARAVRHVAAREFRSPSAL